MSPIDILRINQPDLCHPAQKVTLCELFRSAYGEGYRGDETLHKKLTEAGFALLSYYHGHLNAGCVVDRGRITTIGTTVNPGITEKRFTRMVGFLAAARHQEGVDWISIGTEYPRMQQVAIEAGMSSLTNTTKAEQLLLHAGEADRYDIVPGGGEPVTISKNQYNQNIWTW